MSTADRQPLVVNQSGSSLALHGLMPFGLSFRLCFACSRTFAVSSLVAACLYSLISLYAAFVVSWRAGKAVSAVCAGQRRAVVRARDAVHVREV